MAVIGSLAGGQSRAEDAEDALASGSTPIDRAAARDARIKGMVQLHFDAIWRSLRRLGVADGALDDAAQQVFLVAARRIDEIEREREKPYLLGIAVRVASDARRSRVRRREVSDERAEDRVDPAPSPEELVDRMRARQLLDRVLDEMPMPLRAAFAMFEIEGMSAPEVAEALGIPLGTAASRLRRARALFRETLARHTHREGAQDA
ncbi:MAG TPA: sigma-70 family RNA polymerase sigma factor [Polyangiaceae bacterium]|jgi:RNA polymerase sigma-70 factor (ECF subfamily)